MSSLFIFIIGCAGMYKLGAYNQQHPGESWRAMQLAWSWLNGSWK